MQMLLSSGSPRRKELLSLLGIPFRVVIPNIPEVRQPHETPRSFCLRVSKEKAILLAKKFPDALVIGADTIVVIDGTILGKPRDPREAYDFLTLLQDKTHYVLTGYTIASGNRSISRAVKTKVRFRAMTAKEITWYISTGEPMDKAGAYALQGIGSLFIKEIHGCYTNVIGLPLSHLYKDLNKFGILPQSELFERRLES
jgi:septum formation protein